MNAGDVDFLIHLVETSIQLSNKMEKAYIGDNASEFNKNKKEFIRIQKKIDETLR